MRELRVETNESGQTRQREEPASMRRVAITGVGVVSPLGCGVEHVWRRLLKGDCGVTALPPGYLPSNVPVHVAALVPRGQGSTLSEDPSSYNEGKVFGRSVSKELALFTQFALFASDLALTHAHLDPKQLSQKSLERFGVTLSSGGVGSVGEILTAADNFKTSFKKLSPYFIPKVLINMAGGHISIRHGLKGPLHTVATACAAGTHAVGDAFNFIRLGYADCMLAGGTEASIDPLSMAGFARLRAVTSSKDPQRASSPFDKDRSGFVMAEGACILVLEEMEHALRRKAPVIAEVLGYGMSSDAYQPTLPAPSGDGAVRSMRMALLDARIQDLTSIGYVNAHATSTVQGDAIEAQAIRTIFEHRPQHREHDDARDDTPLFVSSTKGATGHLLGAAGALELAFTALALRDNVIPPTINLFNLGEQVIGPFHHVPHVGINLTNRQANRFQVAVKNSFGFGGTNATLVIGKNTGRG